jgi:threonine dehydratase
MVSLEQIRAAQERLRGHVRRTPLLDVSDIAGRPLWLKCESHQPGGAFKIRGAMNMLLRLADADRARGVITYSSGNHGQAVALAASRLGTKAVVVMPTTAPAIKVAGVKRWGGEVLLAGTTSSDRRRRAEEEAANHGYVMIPPFDHEWIIEGQATCGLEILEQAPDVDVVLVPVGGGGLLAGVAAVVRSTSAAAIVGVEPAGASKMRASLEAGHPITLDWTETIADGLMPVRPGDLTFQYARTLVDRIVAVDDQSIAHAVVWLFSEAKQVAEPSGAASVAAALWPSHDSPAADRTKKVVAIISGGNVSAQSLAELMG